MYIAIAGNIGSGKTTLTNMLAKHYGWKKFLEPVDDNPYIDDYYKDISRWALNLEVYFLKQRFKNLLEIEKARRPSYRTGPSLRACMFSLPTTRIWGTWTSGTTIPIWDSSTR